MTHPALHRFVSNQMLSRMKMSLLQMIHNYDELMYTVENK